MSDSPPTCLRVVPRHVIRRIPEGDAREVVQRDDDTFPVGHRGYERHDHPGEIVDYAVDFWSKFFNDNEITP